jgi:hypothetical protein
MALLLPFASLRADTFLEVPPPQPAGERLCPGATRMVIPFRTGPQVTHIIRVVFPQVARPAAGGWNSPALFFGITTNPSGPLFSESQMFRYTQPEAGAAVADILFDRPYQGSSMFPVDQPGGAGLAANTDYFIVLDFSTDVSNGVHSGWCLTPGAKEAAAGEYRLTSSGGPVPAISVEGVIHVPPLERPYTAYPPGAGPTVHAVTWGQRGDGTGWDGAGNQATFSTTGQSPAGGTPFPPSPPPWRALEATVEGPGAFHFHFSGPVLARGGRELDYAGCSLWVDGARTLDSIPAGGQTLALGPGPHRLHWVPEMGAPAFHMSGNEFTAAFTLSDVYFGPPLTVTEALNAGETAWIADGAWNTRARGPGQDWAWSDFPHAETPSRCFSALVTGPGRLLFQARLLVSYHDLQAWFHSLQADRKSSFRVTIDGQPAGDFLAGTHTLDIPAGSHEVALNLVTQVPDGAISNRALVHAEIGWLQYVPAQPVGFAAWLEARGLPPSTPMSDDADGNGVPAGMEWSTGVLPGSAIPLLAIAHSGDDVILTGPRNRSAAVDWMIEEMVPPGPWNDVTAEFAQDFATESRWRARRDLGSRPAAFYRLRAQPR